MEEEKQELVNIDEETNNLVQDIVNTKDTDEFKELINLFNLNQSKKNALRVVKLNEFLEKIEDQAIERFDKKPNQMSNQELLEYLKAIENSIDRSQKYVNEVESKPMIQLNQQNNINIEAGSQLDRESREKVLDVIQAILSGNINIDEESEVIEGEIETDDNN